MHCTELKLFSNIVNYRVFWSGRRDSNPRLQPWQGCALPLSYARFDNAKISNLSVGIISI